MKPIFTHSGRSPLCCSPCQFSCQSWGPACPLQESPRPFRPEILEESPKESPWGLPAPGSKQCPTQSQIVRLRRLFRDCFGHFWDLRSFFRRLFRDFRPFAGPCKGQAGSNARVQLFNNHPRLWGWSEWHETSVEGFAVCLGQARECLCLVDVLFRGAFHPNNAPRGTSRRSVDLEPSIAYSTHCCVTGNLYITLIIFP